MKFKEYTKLMKTPFDDLSKKDQQKRTTEFNKRLKMAKTFMAGIVKGKIDQDFIEQIPSNDPLRKMVEIIKLKIEDNIGAEAQEPKMSYTYEVTVQEKTQLNLKTSLYIDLPKELMDKLNWKKGEKLVWEETEVLGDKEEYSAAYICRKVDWDNDIKPMFEEKDE